jgi:UDP-N-acetyl-D-mannosaminuronate dehydrogenase
MMHGRKLAVIGLGYVGLPVAVSFGRSGVPVVGFDVDSGRVAELKARTGPVKLTAVICVRKRYVLPPTLPKC